MSEHNKMEDWEQRLLSIEPRLQNWKKSVEREFARVCKERRLRGFHSSGV